MGAPAAVLLVPRSVRRRRGSIVAIAGAPDEADIEVASAIAAAAREELVVIEAYQRAEPSRRGPIGEPKTPTRRIPAGCGALTDAQHLATLLANGNESLIVIARGHCGGGRQYWHRYRRSAPVQF
jgi:hypothetical protein